MTDKEPKKSGRGANLKNGPGKGRPKGVPNKTTKLLKEAILGAAEEAGGQGGTQAYLLRQARKKNNAPFMALLAKVLPMQITGEDGGPLQVQAIKGMTDEELLALVRKPLGGKPE
jgi:hypothetical protein